MATKYVDHGVYGAYAATPTWGVPQDGDGSASAAATASAVASIVFTGVPAGTISVCGVSVSPTWGASADAAANGLATAINAATGNVTTTGFRASAVQLRNAVYARGPSGGAPAGTCEIMTRHGSATFNGQTAIAHTLTNVDAGASSLTFAGGAGGCWGWLFNLPATIWASAVAIGGYGLWAAALPYAGTVDAGDVIKVRSNKTINGPTNTTWTNTLANIGTASSYVIFEIDDGTTWPADGSTPVLTVASTFTSAPWIWTFNGNTSSFAHIKAKQYANGQRNLVLEISGSTSNGFGQLSLISSSPARLDFVDFVASGTLATANGYWLFGVTASPGAIQKGALLYGCRVKWPGQSRQIFTPGSNYTTLWRFVGCTFEQDSPSTAATGLFGTFGGWSSNVMRLEFDACRFVNFVQGSRLVVAGITASNAGYAAAHFIDCDFGNVTVRGPNYLSITPVVSFAAGETGIFAASQYGNREFVYDNAGRAYAEWVTAKGRPTLNARLPDGTTAWSIYAVPTTVAANLADGFPAEIPIINKLIPSAEQLAEGVRTFTFNFLLESTLLWTKADVSARITYIGTDDVVRVVDTYDHAGGAISSNTANWSATTWNGQTWSKKEFSVATPDAVKAGTEVSITIYFHTSVTADTLGIILDPDVVIT